MLLYVNGDSHSAAAEAAVHFCFAEDDQLYRALGRKPHPDNLKVSYGYNLADQLGATLACDAESASSNDRIIRTTKQYLEKNTPSAVVIGWATWEREEWLHDDIYWQVNAGGIGNDWPQEIANRYKEWVIHTEDNYAKKELEQHEKIWQFHNYLKDIPHLFFNTYSCFAHIRLNHLPRYDWGNSYIDPYKESMTYYFWLLENGYQTVSPTSYHFGIDAHKKWAEFLNPHLTKIL